MNRLFFLIILLLPGLGYSASPWQCPDIHVTNFNISNISSSATAPGSVGTSNGNITYNWKNNVTYGGAWWEWIGFYFIGLSADSELGAGWYKVNDYLSVKGRYVAKGSTYVMPDVALWMTGSGPVTTSGGPQSYPITLEFYLKLLPVDGALSIPVLDLKYGIYYTSTSAKPSIEEVVSCPSSVYGTSDSGGVINIIKACDVTPNSLNVDFGVANLSDGAPKRRTVTVSCSGPVNMYASISDVSGGNVMHSKKITIPTNLNGVGVEISAPNAEESEHGDSVVLIERGAVSGSLDLDFKLSLDLMHEYGEFNASALLMLLRD